MTAWFDTFFIDSSGILMLAQALLSGALAGLLLQIRRPTRATRLLAGSAVALAGLWLSNFLIAATLMSLWLKMQTFFLLLGSLLFIQFAYHYPVAWPEQRREARRALAFSLVTLAAMLGWRLLYPDRATTLFRLAIFAAISLAFGWTLGVWLRRLRYFKAWVTAESLSDAVSARAVRAFIGVTLALLALITLSLLIAYVVTPMGYLPQPALALLFHLNAAAFLLLLTTVYLNHAAEQNSLMDKLLFSTLVIVVTLVGMVGQVVLMTAETEYQAIYAAALRETEAVLQSGASLTAEKLPEAVSVVLTRSLESSGYTLRFARDPHRVEAAYLGAGRLWCERSVCRTGPGPEQRHYVAMDTCLEHAGLCYVVGLDYAQYRAALQRDSLPIVQMLLAAVLLVWLLIPRFFHTALVAPLDRLLQGVREVNAGNFAIHLPIQYNDEIGRVTQTFNFMTETIHREREHLEEQVSARTAELLQSNAQLQVEITERKRVENALREAKETAEEAQRAAEEANRAKSVFLANMSHELRTPLNAVLGFSQLLAGDTNFTAGQRRNLETINRSGEHLLMLINDILEISKIESGRIEFQPQAFDLYEVLHGLVELFQLRAAQRGLALTLDYAPETLPQHITTDLGKLRQVLINLLGNAVKFTPRGQVTLRVQVCAPLEPGVEVQWLSFEVADTGVGIAPEELGVLFRPFMQTTSGKQAQQGAGLGLTISHKYVALLGGELCVESEPDVGSRFHFRIPVTPEAEFVTALPPLAETPLPPDVTRRILVAEDEGANRQLLREFLQRLGFEVRTVENGQEALAEWARWRPHLILMDIRMPVLDGREATRRIRAAPGGAEPVIIALTAHAFEEQRQEFLAVGCDDFIYKPYRYEVLRAALYQHLNLDAATPASPVSPPAALPAELRAQFRQAAASADISSLYTLLDAIAGEHPHWEAQLRELTDNFAYQDLIARIEDAD